MGPTNARGWWLLVFLMLLISPGRAAGAQGLLDGMEFVGQQGVVGKGADYEDRLRFADGLFLSQSCAEYGFSKAPYHANRVGEEIEFQAHTSSDRHGTIVWRGVVRGRQLEASFTWTKQRWYWDTRREYWFKGTLVPDR